LATYSGAQLYHADLSGADLEGADLREVIGLTKQQIEKAYLCQTKLPEDIDIDPNRDCGEPHDRWVSKLSDFFSSESFF
jgi:hypothetical protein